MARKVNLEKVLASLNTVCPKRGKKISPAEARHGIIARWRKVIIVSAATGSLSTNMVPARVRILETRQGP
jgi:hypothetical protein